MYTYRRASTQPQHELRAGRRLGASPGWYQGGYTGWVVRVGNTGYPASTLLEETPSRRPATAGSGPPPQAGVGRKQAGGRTYPGP